MMTAPRAITYTSIISKLFVILVIAFFFGLSPSITFASVVINELLPDLPSDQDEKELEWIELFNTSDSPIDIMGYVLKDAKDAELIITSNHTHNGSTTISPKSFIVVYRKGAAITLNNNEDTIFLYESTQSAEIIDQVAYTSAKENKSWGRIPDGTGNVTAHLIPSPNGANSPPPTETPKPTATPRPQPTKKSTPTAEPKQTTPYVPDTKPTSNELAVNDIETEETAEETSPASPSSQAAVLGIMQLTPPTTPVATVAAEISDLLTDSNFTSKSWIFFISSGILFTLSAVIRLKKQFAI